MSKNIYMFELVQPSPEMIKVLYKWIVEEKHHELYTCRPVNPIEPYEEFYNKSLSRLEDENRKHFVLRNVEKELLGEIKGFDYNPRNNSLEFGYYLPPENRHKGYGEVMIRMFIDQMFERYKLNKLYATTSGNNQASKGVLEKIGFKLDGKNREHYWIENKKYDQYIYSLLQTEWESIKK